MSCELRKGRRKISSMIHSARPQSRPSVIFEVLWRTDGRTTCVKIVITTVVGLVDQKKKDFFKSMREGKCFDTQSKHVRRTQSTSSKVYIGPPGHGTIGCHYFNAWCPYVRTYVRPSQKQKSAGKLVLVPGKQNKQRTPCVNIMIAYWLWPGGSS